MTDMDCDFAVVDESYAGPSGTPAPRGTVGSLIMSPVRYYVRWHLEVWNDGALVVDHKYNAKGKPVLIKMPMNLGDCINRMRAALNFHHKHKSNTVLRVMDEHISLFKGHKDYEGIEFSGEDGGSWRTRYYYGLYSTMHYKDIPSHVHEPYDRRISSLTEQAAYMLGVTNDDTPPRIVNVGERPFKERYVTVAVQASSAMKKWTWPGGWEAVVDYLKGKGYRVVCIDWDKTHAEFSMPPNAEDQTGPKAVVETARWIKHSEFFIGGSSGLTWLAWALKKPVVMIAGFTHPSHEFYTPYRVQNPHVCNSCWGRQTEETKPEDQWYWWCPEHQGTPRQFECMAQIRPAQVIQAIDRLIAAA